VVAALIEIRDAGPDAWALSGTATTWGRPYFVAEPNGDTFREVVERGAFDTAISGIDSVGLRLEHHQDMTPLASTDTGDLGFSDGDAGLLLAAALSKSDPDAADAVRRVRERDLRGLSVGMIVSADERGLDADGRTELRRIYRARLNEVSPVSRPMNPFAVISGVRGERRGEPVRVEYRFGRSLLAPNDSDDLRLELEWSNTRAGVCARSTPRGVTLAPNGTDELESELWRSGLRAVA
jgi:HK97 family phage prohead protease